MLTNANKKDPVPIACPVSHRLCYVFMVRYAAMTRRAKNKLQIVQNKMVRFILHLQPRTHLMVDHMTELNLLRVSERAKQLRLNTTQKIYYNQAPQYLPTNFKKLGTGHNIQETARYNSGFMV